MKAMPPKSWPPSRAQLFDLSITAEEREEHAGYLENWLAVLNKSGLAYRIRLKRT